MVVQRQLYARLAQRAAALLAAVLTAVMLLVLTALYLLPDLVTRLAVRELSAADISIAEVELVALSPNRLVLQDIVLGEGGLAVRRLTVDGALIDLPDEARLERLRVEGLIADGAITEDGVLEIAGIPSAADRRPPAASTVPQLPFDIVEVVDATVRLNTPWGETDATLAATGGPTPDGGLRFGGRLDGRLGPIDSVSATADGRVDADGRFSLGLELVQGDPAFGPVAASAVSGWAHVSGDLGGSEAIRLSMQAAAPRLDVADLSLTDIELTLSGPVDAPDLAVLRAHHPVSGTHLRADLTARTGDTQLQLEVRTSDIGAAAATAGAEFSLEGEGVLFADLSLPAGAMTAPATLQSGPVSGTVDLRVTDLEWPSLITGGAVQGQADVHWREGLLRIDGQSPWALETHSIAGQPVPIRGWVGDGAAGGPGFDIFITDQGWTVGLETAVATVEPFVWGELTAAAPSLSAAGRIAPDETALAIAATVALDGRPSADIGIADGEITLSGALQVLDDGWQWTTSGPIVALADALDAYGVSFPEGLLVDWTPPDGGSWLTVDSALRWQIAGNPQLTNDSVILPDGSDLAVVWPDLALTASGTAGSLETMTARVEGGSVTAPEWGWAFSGLLAEAGLSDPDVASAQIELSRVEVRPLADPAPVVPLILSGRVDIDVPDEGIVLSGSGTAGSADGNLQMGWSARHDVRSGTGGLTATLETLAFATDGLQPASLSPMAESSPVSAVSGTVAGTLSANWTERAQETSGNLQFSSLGFSIAGVPISGVSGELAVASLAPLVIPAGQSLSIGRVDLGIPLTNGEVALGLNEDGHIVVDHLVFDLAGGSIAAEPFIIHRDGSDQSVVLDAEAIDLAELFAAIDLPALSATGRLNGRIPVRLGADMIRIDNGSLESTAPGVIRYVPEEPPATAEAGVALLLQALRDFRYESLSMTLNGETGGETEIGLRISGANPELYDGYPIALNVNVSGELYDLLRQGLAAGRYARQAEEYYRDRVQDQALDDILTGDGQ